MDTLEKQAPMPQLRKATETVNMHLVGMRVSPRALYPGVQAAKRSTNTGLMPDNAADPARKLLALSNPLGAGNS